MPKILIVDDDPHIRELVRVFLEEAGMEADEAENGLKALASLEQEKADLVILDVMMPGMDGWELCRELQRLYEMPVLMLTAKGETKQIVKGFDLGADDYLVKPFQPAELIVRVKALLKRYQVIASQTVAIGSVRMNRRTFEAVADNEKFTLPLKEFELLFRLGSSPGRTLTREQLIEEIWGYDFEGNERTLDVHINRLRERFSVDKYGFKIRTIRGLGYRLEVVGD
ncbi:response regulator transcription factor [Paenibacillus sp. Marseille-P2973]|uniref:response regulator transcription factor n=1 Tax=Paenibacillus sp. Marseille-P2973 TaxID=1871032 RepID=UPI001B370B85|nr:response regulator transcription factor [Paenibacillus sp. Marseille-P2973]MBQ4899087.1 response regulator transcription factor [Paenibacillus sp. Marseille-P2973]